MPLRRATILLLTAAVLALIPPGARASASCAGADDLPTAATLAGAGQATLCLLNGERAAAGLAPLAEAPGLTAPSLAYSSLMVSQGFFGHVAPSGATLVDRLTAAGYIAGNSEWIVGENLAWGQGTLATPRNIVAAWMKSDGHRANILTGGFAEIGLGIVLGTPTNPTWGATYTTDFGTVPHRTAAAAYTPAAPAPSTAPARRQTTRAARAARRCTIARARGRAATGRAAKARRAACARAAKARRASTKR